MRIGVPGEFHEDRWPRTAKDSERRVLPRTREASGPSDTSYRVAKRSSDRSSAGLRPVFGTTPPSTTTSVPSRRGEGVIYRVFGTATLPTGTSVASRRDKGGFYPVFGTATLPTSISVASSRGEGVIYRVFGTASQRQGISGAGFVQ